LVTGPSQLAARLPLERTATLCLPPEGSIPASRQHLVSGGRPLTAAFSGGHDGPPLPGAAAALRSLQREQRSPPPASRAGASSSGASTVLQCRQLTLVVLDTWGDSHFVGLSGLQLLGADGQALPLSAARVAADPPDLNVFPGHSGGGVLLLKTAAPECWPRWLLFPAAYRSE
jgi:hypothetical protein